MSKTRLLTSLLISIISISICRNAIAGSTPPVTTYVQTPSSPDGENDWYVSPVKFDLQSTDLESGVKEINYRIDGGTWQTVSFWDSLNLAPNPSFEIAGGAPTGIDKWGATLTDGDTTYSRDTSNYATGFATASAKTATVTPTAGLWHGINNKQYFAVASAYENMTVSGWLKTENVSETAYIKVYSIADDGFGGEVITLIDQSSTLSGTNDWTYLSLNVTVLPESATGIYLDIGLKGIGTVWADAITINSSTNIAETTITIGSDNANHTFEFYAVDQRDNTETYSCSTPKNCVTFKLDMTPPGNWYDSGAYRGQTGAEHELWVYTNVVDNTSGLSDETDKYQYRVEAEEEFGVYENILGCNTAWLTDSWVSLISPPITPGETTAYLLTPKTDFCNSNWKICKTVKFYAKDMAGNINDKDFCLNGPWIKVRGKGVVRANNNIDMIAEPEGYNTDSLIEVSGNSIDFFTSSTNWAVFNSPVPPTYNYSDFWDKADTKTEITDGNLVSSSGVYYVQGSFEIKNQTVPNDYNSDTFNQVVFIDGDLTVSNDITVDDTSVALFIVSGSVNIAKNTNTVGIAILADGDFYTAHDINEGESSQTLELNGIYSADNFIFQRTLQGTGNDESPSEDFIYEPKILIKLKDFFGNYTVTWRSVE